MNLWAGQWCSKNKRDGETKYILSANCLPKLFRTRSECREWLKLQYGYIANRPDLRVEPFGWRMPRAIKVSIREVIKEEPEPKKEEGA